MAFNGAGVFVRLYSWAADAAAAIKIRADRMDNEFNGIATGLSTCLTKDGQTTPTANLPMGGYKHQNVANGASRTEYPSLGQVQDGNINWVDGGGTADAITASYTIPITVLVDGQICWVRATAANATTTPTFSPSGLTARTIVKNGGEALAAGEISADGHQLILRYDLANTRWELLNPKNTLTPSSTTTVSNKTLDNTNTITVKDVNFTVQDDGDVTKQAKFQLSGLGTGVTANLAVVASGTIQTKVPSVVVQTFTASGTYTPTTGMEYCTIEVVGGGGGSGGLGASATGSRTGGGGGGGYARKTVAAATIGASQTVTIGAAGAAGANTGGTGGTGGTTSVGTIVTATGGVGSAGTNAASATLAGALGGVGASGDLNSNGNAGGSASPSGNGGTGGASYFGGGGIGANSGTGTAGTNYGGGGGGDGPGQRVGWAGAAGVVIITEYVRV